MLAEVAGKKTASIHLTETAKMQKDMIGHCLAGTGGAKGWKDGSPVTSCSRCKPTPSGNLPAIDQWNAVKKKNFDVKR